MSSWGFATVTIAVTTVALLVVRWLGVRFTRQEDVGQPARIEPEGLNSRSGPDGFHGRFRTTLCRCEGPASFSNSPIPAGPRMGDLLRGSWTGLPVGGVGRRPTPATEPCRVCPLARTWVFFAFAVNAHKAGWVYILLIMVLYPMALLGRCSLRGRAATALCVLVRRRPFQRKTDTLPHFDHFIGCFSKNSHIKSLAEMFRADLPRVSAGDLIPGQVCPPPSITTKTTSVPSLPAA